MSLDQQGAIQEAEAGEQLIAVLKQWVRRLPSEEAQLQRYQNAVPKLAEALRETIKYMKKLREGAHPDGSEEDALTRLWHTAGGAVAPLDPQLSNACYMKGLGWTDPHVWTVARARGLRIGIAQMQEALMELNKGQEQAARRASIPRWFPIAGVVFAAVTILFLMYLVLYGPPVELGKKRIFDLLMAFCAASSAAFLGGSAAAKGAIPFFKESPIQFSAWGGIGIFIVVYLILHNT